MKIVISPSVESDRLAALKSVAPWGDLINAATEAGHAVVFHKPPHLSNEPDARLRPGLLSALDPAPFA